MRVWWAQWAADRTQPLFLALKSEGYKDMRRVPEGTVKGQMIGEEREISSWLKSLGERERLLEGFTLLMMAEEINLISMISLVLGAMG